MFLEFDFFSIKNTPNLTFDFYPSRDRGYPWGPVVHRIKNSHKTKSDQRMILGDVPFKKNIEIPKFWLAPYQPRLPALISLAMGQKSKFRFQRFVHLIVLFPKRYDWTLLPQNPWRR